jgi:hypothetical protein
LNPTPLRRDVWPDGRGVPADLIDVVTTLLVDGADDSSAGTALLDAEEVYKTLSDTSFSVINQIPLTTVKPPRGMPSSRASQVAAVISS